MTGFISKKVKSNGSRPKPHIAQISRHTEQLSVDRPRLLRRFLLVSLAALAAGTIIWQALQIVSPPELSIVEPVADLVTEQVGINIVGQVTKESQLTINGEQIIPDRQGNFSLEVNLQPGLNTFTFTAQRRYSKTNTVVRSVYFKESTTTDGQVKPGEDIINF